MLKSNANWNFLEKDEVTFKLLDDSIHLSTIVKEILMQRGIYTEEAVKQFINPDLKDLYNPENLSMIDKAANRIHEAIAKQERILIYGDYDADGVSSTALLLKALKELGAICDFYIPNRFTEGYGPNEQAFKQAYENNFKVIITVDTGIASIHEAEIAKELGIDLIITDHHELQEELPDAFAVINPKCSPNYEFDELAGVGVAFKLAHYLLGYLPEHLLDLVAIGTIADLVPLVSENRILASHGLQAITNSKNIGLQALKRICNIDENVTSDDVGFSIGPRLNAVGRIKEASLAVELLMTETMEEAEDIAMMIDSINKERQKLVTEIFKEAEEMVNIEDENSVIFVMKEGWNEGVLGIVASRLVQKYDRPTFVLAINEDTLEVKGSARSIPAFNIFESCMQYRELFIKFGGHSQAAGMTIAHENINELEEKLNDSIKQQLSDEDFKKEINIHQTVHVKEIDEDLVNELSKLEPFGMKNEKPIFHIEAMPYNVRQIGNMRKHLKIQMQEDNRNVEGIGFSMGELFPYFTPQTSVSIVGELGINEWNGNRKAQIIIRDMRIDEWQLFDYRGRRDFDIDLHLERNKQNLVIYNSPTDEPNKVEQTTYYDIDTSKYREVDSLYLFDLPSSLETLEDIIKKLKPKNIFVNYHLTNSIYLKAFPSRDDFKKLYVYLLKQKQLNINYNMNRLINLTGWEKEKIEFIIHVFHELEFISMNDGIVEVRPEALKRDLTESELYQSRMKESELERVLYYSNYEDLKMWFESCLEDSKEEVVYGL